MAELRSTRYPEFMSEDRADLDALLASTLVAHIAFVHEGGPIAIPTAVARWGDRLIVHGSTGSRWMRRIAGGAPVAVSMAAVDGIVVARSAFESAIVYRSGVVFGSFAPLDGADKEQALDILTDRILPGRTGEVRRPTSKELAATMMLAMPIETWSVRILDDWPDDDPADVRGEAWAGLVRFGPAPSQAFDAPDLAPGIARPTSLTRVHGVR